MKDRGSSLEDKAKMLMNPGLQKNNDKDDSYLGILKKQKDVSELDLRISNIPPDEP